MEMVIEKESFSAAYLSILYKSQGQFTTHRTGWAPQDSMFITSEIEPISWPVGSVLVGVETVSNPQNLITSLQPIVVGDISCLPKVNFLPNFSPSPSSYKFKRSLVDSAPVSPCYKQLPTTLLMNPVSEPYLTLTDLAFFEQLSNLYRPAVLHFCKEQGNLEEFSLTVTLKADYLDLWQMEESVGVHHNTSTIGSMRHRPMLCSQLRLSSADFVKQADFHYMRRQNDTFESLQKVVVWTNETSTPFEYEVFSTKSDTTFESFKFE